MLQCSKNYEWQSLQSELIKYRKEPQKRALGLTEGGSLYIIYKERSERVRKAQYSASILSRKTSFSRRMWKKILYTSLLGTSRSWIHTGWDSHAVRHITSFVLQATTLNWNTHILSPFFCFVHFKLPRTTTCDRKKRSIAMP